jgi:hypothetical protein
MKMNPRFYVLVLLGLIVSAGCSALPGLRVLTGEDSAEAAAQAVELTQLVMGDKSNTTDPSLSAAADRIEQATGGTIDIIQIGKIEADDVFQVDLLWNPDNLGENSTAADVYDALRRVNEVIWQGTMQESQGSDMIYINSLAPIQISTLDRGTSFTAVIQFKFQISRADAIVYLSHRPNDLQDFVDLIVDGKMIFEVPEQQELYTGQPNHPVFMLAAMQAAASE